MRLQKLITQQRVSGATDGAGGGWRNRGADGAGDGWRNRRTAQQRGADGSGRCNRAGRCGPAGRRGWAGRAALVGLDRTNCWTGGTGWLNGALTALWRRRRRLIRFPIVTFIDTPGAYADLKSEELGQGEAIARNLRTMFGLKVPIVSIVIGEGGSGGALAIGCANKLLMLENAVFYVARQLRN